MATITASGKTDYGLLKVIIRGEEKVQSIETDSEYIRNKFQRGIDNAEGVIANDYQPEAGTMLQAYAYCLTIFREKDITVDGGIGEIPSEPGVIY